MSNTMFIHYCGGCGINLSRKFNKELSELGDGFCNILPRYIDTSINNMGDIDHDLLWRVSSTGFNTQTISGSGGERRTNHVAIAPSIREYLDNHTHTFLVTGEYHIVVFSASGGSGSVIGPAMISNLRERGIPVIGVMVGDSGNGLHCENTLKTIATLDHIARTVVMKPICMLYYNNHTVNDGDSNTRIGAVDGMFFNSVSVLSLFLSGQNDGIDTRDMVNFLSPDHYSTINVKPGIYCITIHTDGKAVNEDDVINTIGRTLVVGDQDTDIGMTLLHHKSGKVCVSNAVVTAREITPLHIVLTANYLVKEHIMLTETVSEYKVISDSINTIELSGGYSADDNGMIF